MMNSRANHRCRGGVLKVLLTLLACVVILAAAGGALWWINRTEPTARKSGATRKSAALVETIKVKRGDHRPQIVVLGTVEPARDITLSPRVSGQVIELDPAFVPGGIVQEGDLLLRIDPADFETALSMRKSDLKQTEASLEIEKGRQAVAKKEFALLDEQVDPDNRALVLREPQIESIRARVASAEAAVTQATLDLQRTRILAPFDAQILRRRANVGSQVSPGEEIARLVGVDEYWVMATVPLRHLRWLQFEEHEGEGSIVHIRHLSAWEPGVFRDGTLTRMIGSVDERTRMARVLITIADPLARESTDNGPPLILGSMVETRIEGRTIKDVIRLNRDYVRADDNVWVMKDGKLDIRKATIVFRDAEHAYISEGLEAGERVVRTTLATVAKGISLREVEEETSETPKETGQQDETME